MKSHIAAIAIVFGGVLTFVACSVAPGEEAGIDDELEGEGGGSAGSAGDGGNAGTGGTIGSTSSLPCDVAKVITERCATCHGATPAFGAKTNLTSYEQLTATIDGRALWEAVKARIHDESRPMPPVPNPRLTAAETAVLDGWFAKGRPAGKEQCQGTTTSTPAVEALPCTPDLTIKPPTPWKMAANAPTDQYVCFGLDVTVPKKRHVTALAPRVDNKNVLHHILLFQSDTAYSATPTPCEAFGSAAWKLVAGWAPGGKNTILPPEAGFVEEGTTHWVMQLHYNNARALPDQVDSSGYDLCTTDQLRQYDAGLLGFGSVNFKINPRATLNLQCDYKLSNKFQNVKFFSASPHMHKYGTAMTTYRLPGGTGAPETVLEQKAFNFENQAAYPTSNAVAPNDVIRTTCSFKNTTDKQIKFGEATDEEMCFDFVGYYPKIKDETLFGLPIFTWVTPSVGATCKEIP
jgi:hypothetical protein